MNPARVPVAIDVSYVIRQRLVDLELDQKDLAAAVQVTESYISQLLTRKKPPPAPGRTDIYDRISQFLKVPAEELCKLANLQRQQELKKKIGEPAPGPLFKECRAMLVKKCKPTRRAEVEQIFAKDAFGELERLVTHKIVDVLQGLAREELRSEQWLRVMAQLSGRSFEEMRVVILEFLDSDVLNLSSESCLSFLDPMIDYWDVDLGTFSLDLSLNARLAPRSLKRFAFVEITTEPGAIEPGLERFLSDKTLSGDVNQDEIEFLKALKFQGKQPSPLYYYRELQNLRDPLHFTLFDK